MVDNNSTDGSREFFEGRFGHVNFIWNQQNLGFGKANNVALKQARGNYILFLNPDTILPEDCLVKCIAFFSRQKKAGALGVKMIDGQGKFLKESKRGFPAPFISLYKLSGLAAAFPRSTVFAKYYLGHLDENENHEVDVLAGAFMMTTKKVLGEVGGFDEDFFMYGEDIDLSYRIQKAGFSNHYFSETAIIHFKGESTKKDSPAYTRMFYGAMQLFVKKHYNNGIAASYSILIRFAIWVRALTANVTRLPKDHTNRQKLMTKSSAFIVAGKSCYEIISKILSNTGWPGKVIGRISANEKEAGAMGSLAALQGLISIHHAGDIFFCDDEFSVKDFITAMEQLPPGLNYHFHLNGSTAIVHSNNKDLAGDYFTIEKN